MRRRRLDGVHKSAPAPVGGSDLVVHEALRVAGTTRSASGALQATGRNLAQKSGRDRSILDAGRGCS
ncbi:hypothetical protein ACWDOR_27340 [Streptosporangium canum]